MPFQTPDTTIHFPIHQLESGLTQMIKKHFQCPPGDIGPMVTFLYEVREEFRNSHLRPDIAFIYVFKRWCKKYAGRPLILQDIEIHRIAIIDYLVTHSRTMEQEESVEWVAALSDFVRKEVETAMHPHTPVRLTK